MAPLPSSLLSARHVNPSSISDLSISSLELDRRSSPPDLPSYLSTLPLSDRERLDTPSTTPTTSLLFKRAAILSPHEAGALLRAREPAPDTTTNNANGYTRGAGTIAPDAINNKGVLALFGLLSASLVFASIWFFFWAKNGGFVWRKGDWEEYKSTVLRRKGPDGKTLSNATKRTLLGGGSVVGSEGVSVGSYEDQSVLDIKEGKKVKEKGKGKKTRAGREDKGGRDEDVRAYRHEKAARVGGLNRQPDGSYHDYSNTEPSELAPSTYAYVLPPGQGRRETLKDKNRDKDRKPRLPSYTVGSEESFSVVSASTADDRRPLRSSPHHHRHHRSEHGSPSPAHTPTTNRSRQSSPRKHHTHRHSASQSQSRRSDRYTDPIDFESRYSTSEVETLETGTKSYFHPIPGLSGGRGGSGAAGMVEKKGHGANGNGGGGGGFRRGNGGRARRDSLSDSEAETEAYTVRS